MAQTSEACPFCGQMVVITLSALPAGLDMEAAAKQSCKCSGAVRWRSLERFAESMEDIVGKESVKNGFKSPAGDAVCKMIKEAASNVYDGKIIAATIQITPADRVTIHEKKDVLRLTRREVRERS